MPPEVQQPKSSVKMWAFLITLILLAVACFFAFNTSVYLHENAFNQNNISIKQLSGGKLPSDMPADIVLAKDAKILSSYSGVMPNGDTQSTLIYSTLEKATTVIQDYRTYLGKKGWAAVLPISPIEVHTRNTKGQQLSVSTNLDQQGLQTLVSITLATPHVQ